jgi:hypothetical protein
MNTRRFSRTTGEAFRDATYASALHRYERRDSKVAWIVCIAAVAALIVVGWR